LLKNKILKSQGFKNSLWSLVGAFIYPILVVLSTPVFINKLGTEQFGVWVLINTLLQIMSAINLGLGDSTIKSISEINDQNKSEQISKIISNSFTVTVIIVGSISLVALMVSFNVSALFSNFDQNISELALQTIRLAIIIFALKFIDQIIFSVFQGFSRYDISSKITIIVRVLTLSINILCVYAGYGIYAIVLSTIVTQALCILAEILFLKKTFPFLQLAPDYDFKIIKSMFRYGLWSWLQSLLAIITIQIDKLIVAAASGLTILTYYSLGSMLAIQLHSIFYTISSWLFPAVAKKKSENEPLSSFYRNSQFALISLGFIGITFLLLFDQFIFTLWLGEETYHKSINFIRLFLYYNYFLLLNIVPYLFLNGSGQVKQNTIIEFILKAMNIFCMVLFYYIMGDEGLVWGLILSTAIITPIRIHALLVKIEIQGSALLGFESIVSFIFIIFAFELDSWVLKISCGVLALVSYYLVFVRPSSIVMFIKKWK
jgi:O-antigen/teichoic acid export membrane protein